MWSRWFGRKPAPVEPASVPAGHALYAVGDIHGRADLLEALLRRIAAEASRHPGESERTLVFLGDYIDRGPSSRGVVERLLSDPLPGFATVRLLGNHEEAMLDFLDERSDGLDWLSYGGLETLLSYGVPLKGFPDTPQRAADLRGVLAEAVPQAHMNFYRKCSLHHSVGDYVFVHAGVRPGVSLAKQSAADMLWIRDEFLRARSALPGKVVVHGHTICDLPQDLGHRINIDTGAFVSGRLTCLVLRDTRRQFMSTLDV
ncbi:metallophosphoesterase family protein [soil metagenome]